MEKVDGEILPLARSCGSDGGTDPPESACRGRLQTTPQWHWLKTVVMSEGGEGRSMWPVRCGFRRRVQANHHKGVVTDELTSKPGATTIPGTSPSDSLLTGWTVSGVEVARSESRHFHGTAGTRAVMLREEAK